MKKFLFFWANTTSIKYINYHFTQFGEIIGYLDNIFPSEIIVLDADAENLDNSEVLKRIIKEKPIAAAFCVSSENIRETLNLSEMLKIVFPETKQIAYGPLPVLVPGFFCSTAFDAIYSSGDYEPAIESFFHFTEGKIKEKDLVGIKLIKKKKLVDCKNGKFVDSGRFGFTKIGQIPINEYNRLNRDKKIVITLSKGCPYSCPHCLVQKCEGHNERRRDLSSLREYLLSIYPEYSEIKIFSPNFTFNKEYVNAFCELLKKDFPKMKWDCATRVNLVEDEKMLKNMAEAGCTQITLGIETLSKKELLAIGKSFDLEKVKESIKRIQSAGIKVKACVILGIPGQTKNSLKKTLDTLKQYGVFLRPMIYTPYQKIKSTMKVDEIEKYNRKFFCLPHNSISSKKLMQLFFDIENYKEILK